MPALRTFVTGLLAVAYLAAAVAPCDAPAQEPASARGSFAAESALAHGGAHHGETHSGEHGEHAAHSRDAAAEAGAARPDTHADEGHCHEGPSLMPRCPCGCDEKSGARVPGGRLGPTLLASSLPALPPDTPLEASPAPIGHADASLGSPDKIPI
jgi:hypothetical protein